MNSRMATGFRTLRTLNRTLSRKEKSNGHEVSGRCARSKRERHDVVR